MKVQASSRNPPPTLNSRSRAPPYNPRMLGSTKDPWFLHQAILGLAGICEHKAQSDPKCAARSSGPAEQPQQGFQEDCGNSRLAHRIRTTVLRGRCESVCFLAFQGRSTPPGNNTRREECLQKARTRTSHDPPFRRVPWPATDLLVGLRVQGWLTSAKYI